MVRAVVVVCPGVLLSALSSAAPYAQGRLLESTRVLQPRKQRGRLSPSSPGSAASVAVAFPSLPGLATWLPWTPLPPCWTSTWPRGWRTCRRDRSATGPHRRASTQHSHQHQCEIPTVLPLLWTSRWTFPPQAPPPQPEAAALSRPARWLLQRAPTADPPRPLRHPPTLLELGPSSFPRMTPMPTTALGRTAGAQA